MALCTNRSSEVNRSGMVNRNVTPAPTELLQKADETTPARIKAGAIHFDPAGSPVVNRQRVQNSVTGMPLDMLPRFLQVEISIFSLIVRTLPSAKLTCTICECLLPASL